jgi:hypothetical protein
LQHYAINDFYLKFPTSFAPLESSYQDILTSEDIQQTFDMHDFAANQQEYPQTNDQKEGCGFPKMHSVMLTSSATGMVWDIEYAPYSDKHTGELSLFRKMFERLPAGCLIVGNRLYGAYFLFADIIRRGYDVAICLTTLMAFYQTACFAIRDQNILIKQIEMDLLCLSKTVTNQKPRPNEPRRKKTR